MIKGCQWHIASLTKYSAAAAMASEGSSGCMLYEACLEREVWSSIPASEPQLLNLAVAC